MNFLEKCAFLDLADFWLIFRFLERTEVYAFIYRKLNQLRGPFFIFPNNFSPSLLIAKNIPPEFGGYSAPKSVSELNISIFSLFRTTPATKWLDPEVQ